MFPLFPHPSTICHSRAHLQGLRKSQLSLGSHTEAFHPPVHYWWGLPLPSHGSPLTLHNKCHFCSCLDTLKYNFLEEGALFGSFKCLPPLAEPKSFPTCYAAGVMQMLTEFRPSSTCGQPETLTGSDVYGSTKEVQGSLGILQWCHPRWAGEASLRGLGDSPLFVSDILYGLGKLIFCYW